MLYHFGLKIGYNLALLLVAQIQSVAVKNSATKSRNGFKSVL